ncbi:LuxR C-terminal-related transcriptional regulator [Sporosarcina ureae]|uniref:LuxR C-terminal-related transcriptional regulator n=1 Tax=Sporosarcina ureae TaxID=1571 RepID=UPI0009DC4C4D|nr:LuxR C-terminal-related transcriptional regulator [Sporosarcina ureae]ARF17545.1 hypothetical protein SporoP17a_09820 [Sporosarcina ureae]
MVILLASKIQIPAQHKEWISRENMIAIQHEAVQSKVLFINAPTGYGKTTFLTQWSDNLNENVAWLTVDQADNEPLQFFRYIIYTVYSACNLLPNEELQQQLANADRDKLNAMWNFYKQLGSVMTKQVRLIIDDFHHINSPELLEMIQYFVMELPEPLKICFASRHFPPFTLALWQSLFTVTEVKTKHLRFTVEDMKKYLKHQPQQQQLVWQEFIQAEGWPAGLRNALQPQGMCNQIQSDRHRQYAMNVLMNDLWDSFSNSAQHFLLATSILNTMDHNLCDALLGNKESLVHLQSLEEKGFFIERDTEKDAHYRYHPLFAVALQQNLHQTYSKSFIVELHKKAAGVYFQQGDIVQAITHAIIGKAYPLASTWMMNYGEDIIKNRETLTFISWCREFEIANIPLALDLQLLYAFSLLAEHQVDAADLVTSRMTTQENQKDWNAFTVRSQSAAYDYFLIKSYITIIRMGGMTEVGQWLQKGFDLHIKKRSKLYVMPLQFNKTEPTLSRTPLGSPKKLAIHEYQQVRLEWQSCRGNELSIIGYDHGIQAERLYVKGLLKEAREHQVEALLSAHHYQDPGLLIPMYMLSCKLYIANGEMENAHRTLQRALLYTEESHWRGFLYAFEAFIYLTQDNLEEAEIAFSKMQNGYKEGTSQHPFVVLVEARLLLKKGQWEDALKKVLHVKFEAIQEGQIETLIEANILESLCYAYQESWLEMAQTLHDAMTHSKEYGYIQLFTREEGMESMLKEYKKIRKQSHEWNWTQVPYFYVESLVLATKKRDSALDSLTPSEQEVFSLLVLSQTNPKIARNLTLTEESVGVYLTSIYEKLSVKSRAQAMLKAYKPYDVT